MVTGMEIRSRAPTLAHFWPRMAQPGLMTHAVGMTGLQRKPHPQPNLYRMARSRETRNAQHATQRYGMR